MTRVIVCCGVGGTGKTTTAAALGVSHAVAGERVCVLTIDPARRLADALCLKELDNTPRAVSLEGIPVAADGSLEALMLDRKSTWDDVIRRFSPTVEAADRLLGNRYYRAVSTRLTGSHEYMAIEKLYQLVLEGTWDVIVVDTPPTEHALDFFRSPDRVRRVFDRSVMSMLTQPGGSLFGAATRRASRLVRRLAGSSVMNDISEFFTLIGALSGGFRQRSKLVGELLASERTQYYLVVRASAPERNDILGFLSTLRERKMQFAGFLLNRVATAPAPGRTWTTADLKRPQGTSDEVWSEWVQAFNAHHQHLIRRTARHEAAATRISSAADGAPVWRVPELTDGVSSLRRLALLGEHLPPNPAR